MGCGLVVSVFVEAQPVIAKVAGRFAASNEFVEPAATKAIGDLQLGVNPCHDGLPFIHAVAHRVVLVIVMGR
jgi:hypothetical protein